MQTMDTVHVRIPLAVVKRADGIRTRMMGARAPATAAIAGQLNRSSIIRAALERGLAELEASLDEKGTGLG